MSNGANGEYHWRETYFILFESRRRPTLTQVERALSSLSDRFALSQMLADDDGQFESITLTSAGDHAALEIAFESGEAVIQQGTDLAKQLKHEAEPAQVALLLRADARLDVMHFEMMPDGDALDEDDMDEMFDPSCLLMVVESLVELTRGVAIDPASGAILP